MLQSIFPPTPFNFLSPLDFSLRRSNSDFQDSIPRATTLTEAMLPGQHSDNIPRISGRLLMKIATKSIPLPKSLFTNDNRLPRCPPPFCLRLAYRWPRRSLSLSTMLPQLAADTLQELNERSASWTSSTIIESNRSPFCRNPKHRRYRYGSPPAIFGSRASSRQPHTFAPADQLARHD